MPSENDSPRRRGARTWLIVGGVALGLLLLGGVALLIRDNVSEKRQQARAESSVRSSLDRWCSAEPLEKLRGDDGGDFFDEFLSATSTTPRPTTYQLTGITRVKKGTYTASVTLTFPGGPESRVYEVEVQKSGKCFITTKASEDVSGTESHARSVLRSWLDAWVAGEDMAAFKMRHPEVAGQMTADVTWADLRSQGKRLVGYEITTATPTTKGFRFAVTATIEDRGTPETRILRYEVFKDRVMSQGRWTIIGL